VARGREPYLAERSAGAPVQALGDGLEPDARGGVVADAGHALRQVRAEGRALKVRRSAAREVGERAIDEPGGEVGVVEPEAVVPGVLAAAVAARFVHVPQRRPVADAAADLPRDVDVGYRRAGLRQPGLHHLREEVAGRLDERALFAADADP